jgi:hypothetical protein
VISERYLDQKIRTTFAESFGAINAANLKKTHALIESGRSRGKIVLEGFSLDTETKDLSASGS